MNFFLQKTHLKGNSTLDWCLLIDIQMNIWVILFVLSSFLECFYWKIFKIYDKTWRYFRFWKLRLYIDSTKMVLPPLYHWNVKSVKKKHFFWKDFVMINFLFQGVKVVALKALSEKARKKNVWLPKKCFKGTVRNTFSLSKLFLKWEKAFFLQYKKWSVAVNRMKYLNFTTFRLSLFYMLIFHSKIFLD